MLLSNVKGTCLSNLRNSNHVYQHFLKNQTKLLSTTASLKSKKQRATPLSLHSARKVIDPRYADDEYELKEIENIQQLKLEKKMLRKSNLLSEYYARIFSGSSITIFVHGDILANVPELRKAGFKTKRIKNKLIRIAALKMDGGKEDEEHVKFATSLSRGLTTIVYTEEPLQNVIASPEQKMKTLQSVLPLKDSKDGSFKADQNGIIVGAYIPDPGKEKTNMWFTRPGLKSLLDVLDENFKLYPNPTEMQPHDVFHTKLVAKLTNTMGAIRVPLQASASQLSSTLDKIPTQFTSTLQKVKNLREQEQEDQK